MSESTAQPADMVRRRFVNEGRMGRSWRWSANGR